MKRIFRAGLLLLIWAVAACAPAAAPPSEPPAAPPSPAEQTAAQLYVFNTSSPHIAVIDPETNTVVRTGDIPGFTSWTWNDDNNYFDGENLWLGLRDGESDDVEVIALNLDTLEIAARLPLGKDNLTLYIGKAAGDGTLHVGKMGSGQVVAIDTKEFTVLDTWDVPVNGDVVCDADIAVGADGVERFYYPTRKGDTLVSIDPKTGETIKVVETPKGSEPLMLTTAPDGGVWVQEAASNTNAIFDPVTLELVKRFPTGKRPIVASFSADGKYGFIGHGNDTIVTVIDTATIEEVQRIEVGTNPQKLAVHPDGKHLYAILTKEKSVAVIDTESWEVTKRVLLDTDPTGIYMRSGS